MAQTEYQRQWYLDNRDRILQKATERREKKRKHLKLTCVICSNSFCTTHPNQKTCSQECRKQLEVNRYDKFKENNKEELKEYYRKIGKSSRRKRTSRNGHLKRKYGITIEDYNQMLHKQNNRCAICGKHISELNKTLAVDHNHATGKVRGLLCTKCNQGLGHFEDDIRIIQKATQYLQEHQ